MAATTKPPAVSLTALDLPAVEFLTDEQAENPSESVLNERVARYYHLTLTAVSRAVEIAQVSLLYAMALGQVFDIAFRRHTGEFADWLRAASGEDGEGRSKISTITAFRYRTLYLKRDMLFPKDGSEPTCRTLQEAYIKVGLLPAPQPADVPDITPPVFRLTFKTPEIPPDQWPPADRRDFLERTQPIVDLREKLAALV